MVEICNSDYLSCWQVSLLEVGYIFFEIYMVPVTFVALWIQFRNKLKKHLDSHFFVANDYFIHMTQSTQLMIHMKLGAFVFE